MREDQIIRYTRQILLQELGGRGQERLLSSPVRVLGAGAAIDDAVAYLLAGGTPVELAGPPPGGFLWGTQLDALNPDAAPTVPAVLEVLGAGSSSQASMQVVIGNGVAFRGTSACDECWSLTRAALDELKTVVQEGTLERPSVTPIAPETDLSPLGSLAALIAQRLLLGWGEGLGLILWNGERMETGPLRTCQPHSNSQ